MKDVLWIGLVLPFLFAPLPARAFEVEAGPVVICDTKQQVERFAQLFDGDQQAAISAVNKEEHSSNACIVIDAAYVEGREIGMARGETHTFRIVPIMVLAADTPAGYRKVEPAVFYTPVKILEYPV